jgi:putative flippase GtrA
MKWFSVLFEKYGPIWRWASVGTTTAIIDYTIFISIYPLIVSVFSANFFSGLVSIGFNYTAHYFWSFKSDIDHTKSALKYLTNLIFFWSLSTIIIEVLITTGLDPKIAKLIPILIISPISFVSLRFFVFNKSND